MGVAAGIGTVVVLRERHLSITSRPARYLPWTKSEGEAMAKDDPGPSIKDPELYESLRDEGASKEKAARISNAAAATSRSEVGKTGGEAENYEERTVVELRRRAAELGIKGRSSMNKAQLIDALRNH